MERSTRTSLGQGSTRDAPGAERAEWIAPARRLAPLIDGIEYYSALRAALLRARTEIWIVGWEFHSEIDLLRGAEAEVDDGWPVRLADLLLELVRRSAELEIRILIWEGASFFAFERQHVPRMKRPWASHPRLRLVWDRDTPRMGSQHQKFVAIDGRLAFVGGMDLTKKRWDSHAHKLDDRRRRAPGLWPNYGQPYHDLMLAVDGEVAARVTEWARERWRGAQNERTEPFAHEVSDESRENDQDPWPPGLEPALTDVDVAALFTWPERPGREERRQVEAAFVDQLRAARELIFLESQYFSVGQIADVLADRLREPDGPEVVLILPWGCPGPIQSMVMDPRRDELLDRLRAAAPRGRLFVGWPTLAAGLQDDVFENSTYVHAKALVVDDRLLRIGSANLANRSMGLDSELDLFVQVSADDEAGRARIAHFRRRILGHHLDVDPERVARVEVRLGSVVAAIDHLRGGPQTLEPFEHRADSALHAVRLPFDLVDPARPLADDDADRLLDLLAEESTLGAQLAWLRNAAIGLLRHSRLTWVAIVLLVAALIVWPLVREDGVLDANALREQLARANEQPSGLLIALILFTVLATLGFPVTVLIASSAAALGPGISIAISLFGVTASSAAGFLLGRRLRGTVSGSGRPPGRLTAALNRLEDRGVLAVAVLRNLPLGPFALINVACGATRLRFGRFVLGTLIGMAPGLVLAALLGGEIGAWLEAPDEAGLLRIALVIAVLIGLALFLRRRTAAVVARTGGVAGESD